MSPAGGSHSAPTANPPCSPTSAPTTPTTTTTTSSNTTPSTPPSSTTTPSEDYTFIEITAPTSPSPLHHILGLKPRPSRRVNSSDYTFSLPGGARIPGLESGTWKITTVEEREAQIALFASARAVRLVDMEDKNARELGDIMGMFPNVETVVKEPRCRVPLPPAIRVLVDAAEITADPDVPELRIAANPRADPTTNTNTKNKSKNKDKPAQLEKHVVALSFDPAHPLLALSEIEVVLPEGSAAELVLLFTPLNTKDSKANVAVPKDRPMGMLHSLIPALASNMATVYTLVGTETIPRAALGVQAGQDMKERILTAVRLHKAQNAGFGFKKKMKNKVKTKWNTVPDARDPAAYIRFVTRDEYRARVGERQFKVETFV